MEEALVTTYCHGSLPSKFVFLFFFKLHGLFIYFLHDVCVPYSYLVPLEALGLDYIYELPSGCHELNVGPLEEHLVLSAAEPALQPCALLRSRPSLL